MPVRGPEPQTPAAVVEPEAADAVLLGQVVDYYHRSLKETPRALEYLVGRGLAHPEMIDRFRLGFADRTLGMGLPGTPQSRRREEIRARLQRATSGERASSTSNPTSTSPTATRARKPYPWNTTSYANVPNQALWGLLSSVLGQDRSGPHPRTYP